MDQGKQREDRGNVLKSVEKSSLTNNIFSRPENHGITKELQAEEFNPSIPGHLQTTQKGQLRSPNFTHQVVCGSSGYTIKVIMKY